MKKLTTLLKEIAGKFELPSNHKPGMKVPKGGSCCANCKWWDSKENVCDNKYYTQWAKTNTIPAPADEYCSDWYEPKTK